MKIRKINFKSHPIFGDMEIDFTDKNGQVVDTIILVGENGVGKSLLLNTIFEFSNYSPLSEKRPGLGTFEIELTTSEIEILASVPHLKQYFLHNLYDNIFKMTMDYNAENANVLPILHRKTGNTFIPLNPAPQIPMRKILRAIFSDVEINFTSRQINNVTSTGIDKEVQISERSNTNLATEISQLLIDVQSTDALEFTEWGRNNLGGAIRDDKIDVRLKRFTTAFNHIFPLKKYKRIENINNQKHIIFEENGREMTVNQLSSGEKQVVFRGSFLLKDRESSKGALVLIDEPEISLHPNWQLKILSFFKKLFTDNTGKQSSQIIISTHSPFIIHNANRNEDKVIVLQKNDDGKTIISNEAKFYAWSPEKIVQEAFHISHSLSEDKITVFVEGETDEKYFRTCLNIFEKSNLPIEFKWIGRINEAGKMENSGDSALNNAKTFFCANPQQIRNKLILLYDNDTNKPESDIENLCVRKMNFNADNNTFQIGVENLLVLIPEITISDFYKENKKQDKYGAESIHRELDKVKLCSYICDSLGKEKQKLVLKNLHIEIDRLKSII